MLREGLAYRTRCRASGAWLDDLLDLGELHLSGFLKPGEAEPARFPLTLAVAERSGLVQLRHTVDPERLFRQYWYRSATNEAMQAHLKQLVDSALAQQKLRARDFVLDIGCNDGTLLSAYPPGVRRVGFDPARLAPQGVDVFVNDFFSAAVYGDLPRARLVTSIAMFYDLDDPVRFVEDVALVLADDGLWVIEMHYLPDMLSMNSFDAICHEHLGYYSLHSLSYVLSQADLYIERVAFNGVNGGSFQVHVRKRGCGTPSRMVRQAQAAECERLDFERFRRDIQANKQRTLEWLAELKAQGRLVLGYGASTKGNTLLQYYGLTPDLLPAIADRNPDKWGLVTAGTGIPIISEEEARRLRPDYFLALPYHFLPAFMAREKAFLARGGKFMVPMPYPRLEP